VVCMFLVRVLCFGVLFLFVLGFMGVVSGVIGVGLGVRRLCVVGFCELVVGVGLVVWLFVGGSGCVFVVGYMCLGVGGLRL